MPKIQTYQSRIRPGRAPDLGRVPTFEPAVQAFSKTGQILQARGEELLQEYDTTQAVGAYSQLRNMSRDKMSELLQREGASAQGIQTEYDDWHKKTSERVQTDFLSVTSQQELYSQLSEKTRNSDLDSLAGHEARQHKIYKKEVVSGLSKIIERDMPSVAFDDAKQDEMINDYFESLDRLYPGRDLTADKLSDLQRFRAATAKELINENPEYADKWIDAHKKELGDQYNVLKNGMKSQMRKNQVDATTTLLFNKYGENYGVAGAYVLNPNNWAKLKINGAEANKIALQFRTLAADRDRLEDSQRQAYERQVEENDRNVLISWADSDTTNDIDVTLPEWRNRVSPGLIKSQVSRKKTETQVDNLTVLDKLRDDSMRQILDVQEVISEVERGNIRTGTASTLIKNDRDTEYKRARHKLVTALKPSEYDKRFQDKNLKMVEAEKSFEAKAASGMAWSNAADDVIAGYTGDIRRSERTLARPKYLTKEVLQNPQPLTRIGELEAVEAATARAYQSGQISADEYKEEIRNIERWKDLARQEQQIISTEEQERRSKAFKKQVQK